MEAGPKGAVLSFRDNKFAKLENLIAFIGKRQAVISLRPDHKLVYRQAWDNAKTRVAGVHKLMEEIARLGGMSVHPLSTAVTPRKRGPGQAMVQSLGCRCGHDMRGG